MSRNERRKSILRVPLESNPIWGINTDNEIDHLTKLFAEGYNSIYTTNTPILDVIKDGPDDNKFFECAVALDCKIIISGDKHLKEIKKYINIDIMSPGDFLSSLYQEA